MRTDQLQALITISQCTSLSSASEKLHLSVQALSISIKNLENELGLTLMERSSKGIYLTEPGRKLVTISLDFFNELYQLQNNSLDSRAQILLNEPLTIYCHTSIYDLFIPKLICSIRNQNPDSLISVNKLNTLEDINKSISLPECEFIFGFHFENFSTNALIQNNCMFHPLFKCKLICVAHQKFPLSTLKSISLKTLLKYPIILYAPSTQNSIPLLELLSNYGKTKGITIIDDILLHREMIENGDGISISILSPFESYYHKFSSHIVTLDINEDFSLSGGYFTKKDYTLSEHSKIVLTYCQNYLTRHGSKYPIYNF